MANKNSLKDLVKALFEGAEGFEEPAGKVSLPAESEGGSAEHAHKVSGNPKGVKAEAESAPFRTKEKSEWPGKPSPESLLEQLEEEISELMSEMDMSEEDQMEEGEEEAVLEFDEGEVMAEAKKARARLKALREQAEEDSLSLTIDLDGVSSADVSNVNVALDGEELDVDMEEEDMEEPEMSDEKEVEVDMDAEEMPVVGEKEEEEEEETLQEAKVLRKQLAETQLLTARSLYVNKLFVRDDLSGAQKRKIVEYLDSARTLAEAKEVYNRIVRVLNTAKKTGTMNESVEGRRILGEGAGQVVEPSFDTSRWQILAGVKKSGK